MPEYQVTITRVVTFDINVYADNDEEAAERADIETDHLTDSDAIDVETRIDNVTKVGEDE